MNNNYIMKKIINIVFLILLINLKVFAFKDELPLSTGEWPPYTSENINGYGFCTEIVSAIVNEMGLKPKYYFYPWKRTENAVKHGLVFGAFPYALTEERAKEYDFSDLIMENKTLFFYNKKYIKEKPVWITLQDLKQYEIGGCQGFSYVQTLTNAKLNIELVSLDKFNVRKLYANRIDLAIFDELVGWNLIKEHYPNNIDIFDTLYKPFDTGNSHLMISRKYPNSKELTNRFNKALIRIKEKNIYQKIFNKYGINSSIK